MTPKTEAGRTFLEMLTVMDSLDDVARKTPVDWAHGILEIEKQSRAAALREVAEIIDRGSTAMDGHFSLERPDALELRAMLTETTGSPSIRSGSTGASE